MALSARLCRDDVIGSFKCGRLNAAALYVAGLAIFWRTLECTLNVAGFAGQCYMGSGQREPRSDMVEFHIALPCGREGIAVGQGEQDKTQQRQRHGPERNS